MIFATTLLLLVAVCYGARPAVIDIASMTAADGLRSLGSHPDSYLGSGLNGRGTGMGDFDGDRIQDWAVGQYSTRSTAGHATEGTVHLVYGLRNKTATSALWPQDSLVVSFTQNPNIGRVLTPPVATQFYFGRSISFVGDLNGDSFDDLAIQSCVSGMNRRVIVVFGCRRTDTPRVTVVLPQNDPGSVLELGSGISGGDFNGDGLSDLLLGDQGYNRQDGKAYIIWGMRTWPAEIKLDDVGASIQGVKFAAEPSSLAGHAVADVGDINNDGITDFAIGAYWANPKRDKGGKVYLYFGKKGTWSSYIVLKDLKLPNGIQIYGPHKDAYFGYSISGKFDMNGDSISDLVVSASEGNPSSERLRAGITYVIFGRKSWPSDVLDTFDNSEFDGIKGFRLFGEKQNDRAGYSVSAAGAFSRGKAHDLIIGAPYWDKASSFDVGRVYIVYGQVGSRAATLELGSLTGANGFAINGEVREEMLGYTVSGGADVTSDNFADAFAGAPYWNSKTGRSIVIFGNNQ